MMPLETKKILRDDSGIVMFAVIGAILLITTVTSAGFVLAKQAMYESVRHGEENIAFQVAASGLDRELAAPADMAKLQEGEGYNYEVLAATSGLNGDYRIQLEPGPLGSFMYKLTSIGEYSGSQETVETTFFFMDLWAMSISAGDAGSAFGSGGEFSGNGEVRGPIYISGDVTMNSNTVMADGPMFVSNGSVTFQNGVRFEPKPGEKYKIFADGVVKKADPVKTEVYTACPTIDLPWIDANYFANMREKAVEQSSDSLDEVTALGMPSTYKGVRAPGATTDYKVIQPAGGTFTIGATSFGMGGQDDFSYSTTDGIIRIDGVVYVAGNVVIGQGVKGYAGNGVIVADGTITIDTRGTTVEPITDNGDGRANDLTIENCLGLAAKQDILLLGSTFEGVVFTNGRLILDKHVGRNSKFEGIAHASAIKSLDPGNVIEMEINFSRSIMPEGMPGTASDPRGGEFASGGMIVPGTWVRR